MKKTKTKTKIKKQKQKVDRRKEQAEKKVRQDKAMKVLGIIALVVVGVSFLLLCTDFILKTVLTGYTGALSTFRAKRQCEDLDELDIWGKWYPIGLEGSCLELSKGDLSFVGEYRSYSEKAAEKSDEITEEGFGVATDASFRIYKSGKFVVKTDNGKSYEYVFEKGTDSIKLKKGMQETVFVREKSE